MLKSKFKLFIVPCKYIDILLVYIFPRLGTFLYSLFIKISSDKYT